MAAFTQRPNGNWQAKIRRDGWPSQSKTFTRKADAEAWATKIERDMDTQSFIPSALASKTTFKDLADRYKTDVLSKQRGGNVAGNMLVQLVEEFGDLSLMAITPAKLSTWRDERLKVVGPQTVRHALGLISRIYKAAERDWSIPLPTGNPVAKVRKPKAPASRTRRLMPGDGEHPGEYQLLVDSLSECGQAESILLAFELSLETAARKSELISLTWEDVSIKGLKVRLRGVDGRVTKNGDEFREVPLSPRAVRLLEARAKRVRAESHSLVPRKALKGRVLGISATLLNQAWSKAVKRARSKYLRQLLVQRLTVDHGLEEPAAAKQLSALVYKKKEPLPATVELWKQLEVEDETLKNLHWHDLRHEATSRLAKHFEMHELMKITGHKSSAMLAAYYHPDVTELAQKLNPVVLEDVTVIDADLAKRLLSVDPVKLRQLLDAAEASKTPAISG